MSTRTRTASALALAALTPALAVSLATPASAATKDACTGVSHPCAISSTADVDGDGKRDSVGITWKEGTDGKAGTSTVRLLTAKGKLYTNTGTKHAKGDPWWGAAKINRRAGHELVLQDVAEKDAATFRVVTFKDGKLRTQQAPGGYYRWAINTDNFFQGYWRKVDGEGRIRLTHQQAGKHSSGKWALNSRTYSPRWDDSWARVSANREWLTDPSTGHDDLNIPYLQKYFCDC